MKKLLSNKLVLLGLALAVIAAGAAVYLLYFNKATHPDAKVQAAINNIYNSPKWLSDVAAKAKQNGLSLKEQIIADAIYVTNPPK